MSIAPLRVHTRDCVLFFAAVLLFLCNTYFVRGQLGGIAGRFFDGHFHDLLAPLLMLSYTNTLLSVLSLRVRRLPSVLGFIAVCGVVWEYVTPLYKPDTTSDPLDLLAYMLGAVIYWALARDGGRVLLSLGGRKPGKQKKK